MPRKMYRNPEAEPTPERPGSGSPDDSGVRRRPRKEEEESVLIDPEYQQAIKHAKSEKPNVVVESSYQEEIERSKRARKSTEKPKEETLPLEEARARFEGVEQELKEMGVTSEADKMNDPEWLKAYAAFRHAERASRTEQSKRGVREYKEVQAQREERHAGHQARREFAKHVGVRENVDELLGMERERMAEEAKLARRERLAGMKKQVDEMRASLLKQEQADLAERMEKLGGVWGGEEYFKLQDRLERTEAELEHIEGKKRGPKRAKREVPEEMLAGEPTPEDEIADARKTLKFIEDSEKEIATRQKKVQKELAGHGLKTPVRIIEELNKLEEELRAEATGTKPTFWNRVQSLGRRLAGSEPTHATKEALKKYVDLENEMNAQIRSRAEAETQLIQAEKKAGRERFTTPRVRGPIQGRQTMSGIRGGVADVSAGGDMSGFGKTFLEAPEMWRGSKELRTTLALKKIEEDIRNALGEMEAMQDLTESELSDEMFEEKKSNFAKRIRALEEEGKSEAFDQALEEAEEALMRYVMAVHQRRQAFVEEARAAGKGEARPRSVIGRTGRPGGAYVPGVERRVVRLQEWKTQDTREREAAAAPERVNKEVEVYRSVKERKHLIDRINTDENARRAMHGVYEAFKHRMLEKLANEEEVNFRTGSPDPALDYALNLYRKYARRADEKGYVYDVKIRHAAHEELEEIEHVLGKNWDKSGWAAQAVRAISRGKVELLEGEGADVIPLQHVKRALSEEELEEVEELDIPITVEAPMTEAEAPAAEEIPIEEETELGYHGAGSSEFERGVRRSGRRKETPKQKQQEEYGSLTEQELAYLKESLNRLVLSKGNAWLELRPKVMAHFGKGGDWIEQYANLYASYRSGELDRKNKAATRRELDAVNSLLGVEKPSDLIVPPSPELRERVSREAERVESAFARAKGKPKKEPRPSLRAELDKLVQGTEETPTEGQVVEMEKARKRLRGRKKAGT